MFRANVLAFGLLILVPILVSGSKVKLVNSANSLRVFLGSLDLYANTENDVVLLLDVSRSLFVQTFLQLKLCAKLISQRFTVAADHSRVAVVTFADKTDTHVNYIEDPYGNNMCSLLVEIDSIGSKELWTNTDLERAMLEAERILAQSRPGANKIIVLLANNEINPGQSAIDIANRLKKDGIIIFAIGVANVNDAEINAVATDLNHTYILGNFYYIKEMNEYLVNDARLIKMGPARNFSYCPGICDERASWTGRYEYECVCQAGYHGISGFKGHCHECPRGTYKSEALNKVCTPCPPHATTDKEGSTSFLDCKCETGYEKIGDFCSPVRCSYLNVPEGGILIPTYCNNTFGTQCQLQCKEGYCLFSCNELNNFGAGNQVQTLTRICLENKEWSGQEFYCEKRTCPALSYPKNGKHNCSENDFTFGTVCSFHCDEGYEILGSESRTCLINSWTGIEVTCEDIDECLNRSEGCERCVDDVCMGYVRWECADDMVLSEDGKTCIDTGYCEKDGQTYMNEETWISDCQNCVCDKGIVKCSGALCNETECQPGENGCYIISEDYQEISASMCLLTLIIASIVSELLL